MIVITEAESAAIITPDLAFAAGPAYGESNP